MKQVRAGMDGMLTLAAEVRHYFRILGNLQLKHTPGLQLSCTDIVLCIRTIEDQILRIAGGASLYRSTDRLVKTVEEERCLAPNHLITDATVESAQAIYTPYDSCTFKWSHSAPTHLAGYTHYLRRLAQLSIWRARRQPAS